MNAPQRCFQKFWFLIGLLICVGCESGLPRHQREQWRIEYRVNGDKQGTGKELLLGSDGQLVARNHGGNIQALRQAPSALLERVQSFVLASPGPWHPADVRSPNSEPHVASLSVWVGGRRLATQVPEDLNELLFKSLIEALSGVHKSPLNLGRVWRIEEGFVGDETDWEGVWTRRGDSNIFDARWRNTWFNKTQSDVIEVEVAENGEVVLLRRGLKLRYRGRYSLEKPTRIRGTADWYTPGVSWTARIEL